MGGTHVEICRAAGFPEVKRMTSGTDYPILPMIILLVSCHKQPWTISNTFPGSDRAARDGKAGSKFTYIPAAREPELIMNAGPCQTLWNRDLRGLERAGTWGSTVFQRIPHPKL